MINDLQKQITYAQAYELAYNDVRDKQDIFIFKDFKHEINELALEIYEELLNGRIEVTKTE